MLNRYPLWKYLMVLFALLVAMLYALPNLYGEDPAIQVTGHAVPPLIWQPWILSPKLLKKRTYHINLSL